MLSRKLWRCVRLDVGISRRFVLKVTQDFMSSFADAGIGQMKDFEQRSQLSLIRSAQLGQSLSGIVELQLSPLYQDMVRFVSRRVVAEAGNGVGGYVDTGLMVRKIG